MWLHLYDDEGKNVKPVLSHQCCCNSRTNADNKDFRLSHGFVFWEMCENIEVTLLGSIRMPLTLSFLHKNDLRIGAEVLPSQDHLLASEHRAAVHVLLLHHGKLVR